MTYDELPELHNINLLKNLGSTVRVKHFETPGMGI
jgi:hypothetical protein